MPIFYSFLNYAEVGSGLTLKSSSVLARFEGIPLKTGIELSLMTRYFLFMVINGFLIVTLSSGLIAAIPKITKDPTSAVTLLATQLPSASTFFLTYFVTVSFSGAAGALLQIARLILYYVKLVLLGSTPRSVWNLKDSFASVAWGTLVSRFGSCSTAHWICLLNDISGPAVPIDDAPHGHRTDLLDHRALDLRFRLRRVRHVLVCLQGEWGRAWSSRSGTALSLIALCSTSSCS